MAESGSGDETMEKAKGMIVSFVGDISKRSAAQQISVGGGSGLIAGYLFAKVGRAAAFVIGGTVLISQVAVHNDIISINWNKVDSLKHNVNSKISDTNQIENFIIKTQDFISKNRVFVTTFAGGCLLGMAFA